MLDKIKKCISVLDPANPFVFIYLRYNVHSDDVPLITFSNFRRARCFLIYLFILYLLIYVRSLIRNCLSLSNGIFKCVTLRVLSNLNVLSGRLHISDSSLCLDEIRVYSNAYENLASWIPIWLVILRAIKLSLEYFEANIENCQLFPKRKTFQYSFYSFETNAALSICGLSLTGVLAEMATWTTLVTHIKSSDYVTIKHNGFTIFCWRFGFTDFLWWKWRNLISFFV